MEKKRLHTDPIKVKHELQKVADELGLPLNCKVSIRYATLFPFIG